MDVAIIVGDGLLASGGIVAAALGRRAIAATRGAAEAAASVGERNNAHLRALQDESMNERIRAVVHTYAAEHPHILGEAVMFEAMRDLLDAFISASLDEPTDRRRITRRADQLAGEAARRRYVDSDIEETD